MVMYKLFTISRICTYGSCSANLELAKPLHLYTWTRTDHSGTDMPTIATDIYGNLDTRHGCQCGVGALTEGIHLLRISLPVSRSSPRVIRPISASNAIDAATISKHAHMRDTQDAFVRRTRLFTPAKSAGSEAPLHACKPR